MTAAVTATGTARAATNSARVSSALYFPLRKAISKRLWKVWGAGLTGLVVGAGILAAGYFDAMQAEQLGPGFHSLFGIDGARAIRYFNSVHLLLAGQLALFIWWARSRTKGDTPHRYRTWASMATVCFLASFAVAVDAHNALTQSIAWSMGEDLSFQPELGWLVPVGCCLVFFTWMLHADLRHCRTSLVLAWLAALSWIGGLTISRGIEIPLDALSVSLVEVGTVAFGCWCLSMSLLLHARHIVYGRVEQRHSEVVSRRTTPATPKSAPPTPKSAIAKVAAQQKRIDKGQPPTATAKPTEATKQAAGAAALMTRTDLREERAKAAVVDKTLLKGLTKRERREVRKQFRQRQREMRGELDD